MRSAWRFLKTLGNAVNDNGTLDIAAQLAYYSLLALFPFAMFLLTCLGYLPLEGARDQVLGTAYTLMPSQAARLVDGVINEIVGKQRGGLLLLSLFGALWTASGALSSLITALNRAYEVRETRPWWRLKILALVATLVSVVSVVVATAGLIIGPGIVRHVWQFFGLGGAFDLVWRFIRWPIVVGALMFMLANLYYFLPNVSVHERKWRFITPGAVVAVLLWLGGSLAFNLYVTHFNSYAKSYGAIGTIIILITWLYLSGLTVLLGGEINAILDKQLKGLPHEEQHHGPVTIPDPMQHA